MDFAPDETSVAVRDVAAEVFARHQTDWASTFGRAPGSDDAPFDTALWTSLIDAGVIALPLPDDLGGDGVDVLSLLPLLRRMGESAAVTPAPGTLAAAVVLAVADDGPTRRRLSASIADGGWMAVAINEPGDALTDTPRTTVRDGRLNGTKVGVLAADGASALLVTTDAGVIAVDPGVDGVRVHRTPTSSGWGEYTVTFDDVAVADTDTVATSTAGLRDVHRILLAAYADGLIGGATTLTARHVSDRHQFGKPIALFQAVGQQLADIYVVGRSMDLATTAAAWRMSEQLDAQQDLGIATYWMAAEIPAALRTMTHLHGGVGVDITYPLHRYFSIAKDLARIVGGTQARLDELADIADDAGTPEAADVH